MLPWKGIPFPLPDKEEQSIPMTLDEARLMANVSDRARRLFDDGYRARWRGAHVLEVRSPQGAAYRLDTLAATCGCPFFRGHQGRRPCKHLLGWKRLLRRQRACRRLVTLLLLRAWADLDDADPRAREAEEINAREAQELEPIGETEAAHAA